MIFASSVWLFGLLVLPLLVLVEAWTTQRDRARTARIVARPLWDRVLRRPAERWRYLRLALWLLAAAGIFLALARPQWGIVREKVEREGVDVVFALDSSGSMATEDISPNRFFLAKAALLSLVSRLEGDRLALVAFEAEAYPLAPLTLDADAVGLFLDTLEPGIVPAPGSSLGMGIAKGLQMFVDRERRNKVLVMVSDGEDLEGQVEEAIRSAKEAGVVIHTVGVGTEQGAPVPDFDREGKRVGFKKDQDGSAVVSRFHPETLEAIAKGTGGRFFRLTPADTSLHTLAQAIEGIEQKTLAKDYTYRKKERFQIPLGIGLLSAVVALLLPLPDLRRRRKSLKTTEPFARNAAALVAALLLLLPVRTPAAETGRVLDEILLRPKRLTAQGKQEYGQGNHPLALKSFEGAAGTRPDDPAARFNLADGLYKNGKFAEAETLFRALSEDPGSPLAPPSRYNLGNARFQKKDFPGAVQAYREALRATPGDADTIRNLELALRALEKQKQEQQKQQQLPNQKDQKDQQNRSQDQQDQKGQQKQAERQQKEPPKSEEQKERERFQKEVGMPKDRAMQLLDALQQNEKNEQRKILAAKRKQKKGGKDW